MLWPDPTPQHMNNLLCSATLWRCSWQEGTLSRHASMLAWTRSPFKKMPEVVASTNCSTLPQRFVRRVSLSLRSPILVQMWDECKFRISLAPGPRPHRRSCVSTASMSIVSLSVAREDSKPLPLLDWHEIRDHHFEGRCSSCPCGGGFLNRVILRSPLRVSGASLAYSGIPIQYPSLPPLQHRIQATYHTFMHQTSKPLASGTSSCIRPAIPYSGTGQMILAEMVFANHLNYKLSGWQQRTMDGHTVIQCPLCAHLQTVKIWAHVTKYVMNRPPCFIEAWALRLWVHVLVHDAQQVI